MSQTVRCPICHTPYTVYSHMAGDQSACPGCRRIAQSGKKYDPTRTHLCECPTCGNSHVRKP